VVDDVEEAARLGREKGVDMVIAIGGGSVIDSAKIIALCIADGGIAWDIMPRKHEPASAVPLIAILTLAATGTEMNCVSVLQNHQTKQKIGYRHELMYPVHSYLDPTYTLSVPKNYTAYGIVDLVAHCLEAWFGEGDASLSDRFVVSIIQEAMEYGPKLMNDLTSYELRYRIMWAATSALNNLTIYGRKSGDWGCHAMGHILSFLFDTPHGASLSIMYPSWMRVMSRRIPERVRKLGNDLFGTDSIEETINSFSEFFKTLGSPLTCGETGIKRSDRNKIVELMEQNNPGGLHYKLSQEERIEMLDYVL
jgi:alcohol dehydrogenase YqhD (iron-dependent ADH family)